MDDSSIPSDTSYVVRYERLREGEYFADFRRDTRLKPEVYHCIIQREGSSEIIRWTQHRTLDAAVRRAKSELNHFRERQQKESAIERHKAGV
jgi:hypothetical protein